MSGKKFKLAVVTTHPIEFQGPLFKKMAAAGDIDLTVYFCWDFGVKETYDEGFRAKIKWDMPYLEGYRHVFLKNYAWRPTSARFFGCINPGIVPALGRGGYDAVLVLGWQVFSMWLAVLAGRAMGLPVFLRGENPLNQELVKPAWKRALKKIPLGLLFRCVRTFFHITGENKKFYQYYGVRDGRKFIFMPYAVDNDWFFAESRALAPRRQEIRDRLGIGKNALMVLFSGKLIGKKRPLDLLRAYGLAARRLRGSAKTALVFVGDGALREQVEKIAAEENIPGVLVTGFVSPSKVPEYYAAADLYVQPSGAGDTAPMTVNEAMCFGLPLLMSDLIGSAADRVAPGENGYIFPYADAAVLADRLTELLGDPARLKKMGARSAEMIRDCNYDKDVEALRAALRGI